MVTTATPIFPQVLDSVITQFTNADTTTAKAIFTPGTNGSVVNSVLVYSNDTAAVNLQLGIYDGSSNFLIGTVTIAAGSGNTGTVPTIDLLRSVQWGSQLYTGFNYDANGNKTLFLPSGYKLYANCLATMTSAKVCNVFVQGGDY